MVRHFHVCLVLAWEHDIMDRARARSIDAASTDRLSIVWPTVGPRTAEDYRRQDKTRHDKTKRVCYLDGMDGAMYGK